MVYEYTRPRAPVAAMFGSPGPCYGLPSLVGGVAHDPRSAHNKNPSFSFGVRHGKLADDCSPGPCYIPQSKIYKDGKDGTPHYSLYSRPRDQTMPKYPGPGAYKPEAVGPSAHHRHPAYSFGIRHRQRTADKNPAPNAYTLDNMCGPTVRSGKSQAPIYTMRPKFALGAFYEDLSKTPGPGTYDVTNPNIYRDKRPLYSMTGRNMMPGDASQKPGPAAHSPEKVIITKKIAPKHSFGIRHSAYICPLIVDPVN